MALGYYINGVAIESIYGAKGSSTAAATGFKSNNTDLNASLMALADGVALGRNVGMTHAGSDLSTYFGVPSGTLPINGKRYVCTGIWAAGGSGSVQFVFNLTSSSAWATTVTYPGSSSGSPTAGTQDSGAVPSGATQVRYTGTWNNASGDTGSYTLSNGASSATALATNVNMTLSMPGSGTTVRQTTYNFKIEFLNASSVVISTTNFTVELISEGSA